jgi:hypothetical protein
MDSNMSKLWHPSVFCPSKLTSSFFSSAIFALFLKLQEGSTLVFVVFIILLVYIILTTTISIVFNGKLIVPI